MHGIILIKMTWVHRWSLEVIRVPNALILCLPPAATGAVGNGGGGGVSNNIYTSNSRRDNYYLLGSVPREQREKNIWEPN